MHVATSPHDFKLMVHAAGKPKGEGQAQAPGAPAPRSASEAPGAAAARRRRRAVGAARPAAGRAGRAARAGPARRPSPTPRRRPASARLTPAGSAAAAAGGRLTRSAGPRKLERPLPAERTASGADHAGAVQRDAVPGRVRPPELQAAEGAAGARARSRPRPARWSPTRATCAFEHAGSGGLGRMLKKAVTGEGTTLMKMTGRRRGVPGPPRPGHPPHLPRERLHHGQRAEPARLRRRHRLGHQAALGRPSAAMAGGLYNLELRGTRLGRDPLRRPAGAAQRRLRADVRRRAGRHHVVLGRAHALKTDFKMKDLIGKSSGETIQMAFSGQGWVLVQPSEGQVTGAAAGQLERRAGQPARELARRAAARQTWTTSSSAGSSTTARSRGTTSAPRARLPQAAWRSGSPGRRRARPSRRAAAARPASSRPALAQLVDEARRALGVGARDDQRLLGELLQAAR